MSWVGGGGAGCLVCDVHGVVWLLRRLLASSGVEGGVCCCVMGWVRWAGGLCYVTACGWWGCSGSGLGGFVLGKWVVRMWWIHARGLGVAHDW